MVSTNRQGLPRSLDSGDLQLAWNEYGHVKETVVRFMGREYKKCYCVRRAACAVREGLGCSMQLSAPWAYCLEQETPSSQTHWSVEICRASIQQSLAKERVEMIDSK